MPGRGFHMPAGPSATNACLLDRVSETERERLLDAVGEPIEQGWESRWCCAACGAEVTACEQSIQVGGRYMHRCTNPAGIIYVIGCFRRAPGCHAVGEPTAEWSWFAGHRWQVALCRHCGTHLGWLFTGEDGFYGLILDRLVECGRKPV